MKDLIKLYAIVICRTVIVKIQLFIRLCFNGRCYPTTHQRDHGGFRDFYIFLRIVYKYFSVFSVNNNWLTIEFPGPNNDFIFVKNAHGDTRVKNFKEVVQTIKTNNK